MSAPLLRIGSVSKTFPGLRALDDVALEVASGEIVALVGQNGSGKSTLVKILTGMHQADPGARIELRNAAGDLAPLVDGEAGVRAIHQDLGLIGTLSTVENLDLGRALRGRMLAPVRARAERARARALLASFGVAVDVDVPVAELSPAERAIVAIARALDGWDRPDRVLVLDEPTTALHGEEVQRLFAAVREVAARGAGIVFISHRLDEVLALADRVVALRDGRLVADVSADAVDHDALVQMIAGRRLAAHVRPATVPAGDPVLRVRDLRGDTVAGLDLEVRGGEIVGLSGLLGSGREFVCGLAFGAAARTAGEVSVDGTPLHARRGPSAAIAAGVAYVPGDRRAQGAVMTWSARENLTLPSLASLSRRVGGVDRRAERAEAARWAQRLELMPPDPERRLELFSGGNQQKVVLGKWLRTAPRVLLLDEPTQGVDVGAKAAIYALIDEAAASGAAVLVASSDEAELALICGRVVVLRDGRAAAELHRDELDESRLVLEGLGVRASAAEGMFGYEEHADG
jgi:ribose transport system ATP-binding protein